MEFRDFNLLSDIEKDKLSTIMFAHLSSAEDIRNWAKFFLGLELPLEITDTESTSTPLDAIWQIYNTFKTNSGDKNPGYIILSSREGMKTISVAILEVLLMLHFEIESAHAAATETQSLVGLQYIEDFLFKIEPLMNVAGWENLTKNKRTFRFKAPSGKRPFIKVVICSPKGMNAIHSNFIAFDELDLADPASIKEGVNIVGYSKGIHGVAVYLSTRKYAFGPMNKILEQADEKKYKVLRWSILDVTEQCPTSIHLPELPKEDRYVAKRLPLKQISVQEYEALSDIEKKSFDLVPNAFAGCKSCNLLPVCRTRLAQKSSIAVGGFYKPITAVRQKFIDNDADIAESQLLCWAPGSEGLVYPRFKTTPEDGNLISIKKAFETLLGYSPKSVSFIDLIYEMQKLDIQMYCGVDWGFTHDSVLVVIAKIPNGELWVIDCFASPGLEFADILNIAISFRDKYKIQKWFCDQAMPSHIKSFNKNGMKSPGFTKDVVGGIESIRHKIVNATGKRLFKVIQTDNNKKVIAALSKHRFLLDGQGNVTPKPDDEPGIADICDALRYIGQNLFPVKGPQRPYAVTSEENKPTNNPNPTSSDIMREEIARLAGEAPITGGTKRKGGFSWSW